MQNSDLHHSLLKRSLGTHFEPSELEMMVNYGKALQFSKDEIILGQGKRSNGIYIILEGVVDETANILGKGAAKMETLGPGSFFGEISFFEKTPSATSIIAAKDTRCLLLSQNHFEMLGENYPKLRYKLLMRMGVQICARLRKMHDKIIDFLSVTKMTPQSSIMKIIHSFTYPTETSLEEFKIDKAILQKHPFFTLFTQEEIEQLFKKGHLIKASKNCTLISKENWSPSCYIVIQGAVQSSIEHEKKLAKLSVIGPVTLFASVACLEKKSPFTITFTACEQALLLKIVESDLDFFEKEFPKLWYKLFWLIFRSLLALGRSVNKLDIRLNIETYNR